MLNKEKILDKLKTLEALASAVTLECQQTRKLLEADVSTSTEAGISEIAIKAKLDLRAKLFKPKN